MKLSRRGVFGFLIGLGAAPAVVNAAPKVRTADLPKMPPGEGSNLWGEQLNASFHRTAAELKVRLPSNYLVRDHGVQEFGA
jgi:hypothetical protein